MAVCPLHCEMAITKMELGPLLTPRLACPTRAWGGVAYCSPAIQCRLCLCQSLRSFGVQTDFLLATWPTFFFAVLPLLQQEVNYLRGRFQNAAVGVKNMLTQ